MYNRHEIMVFFFPDDIFIEKFENDGKGKSMNSINIH